MRLLAASLTATAVLLATPALARPVSSDETIAEEFHGTWALDGNCASGDVIVIGKGEVREKGASPGSTIRVQSSSETELTIRPTTFLVFGGVYHRKVAFKITEDGVAAFEGQEGRGDYRQLPLKACQAG